MDTLVLLLCLCVRHIMTEMPKVYIAAFLSVESHPQSAALCRAGKKGAGELACRLQHAACPALQIRPVAPFFQERKVHWQEIYKGWPLRQSLFWCGHRFVRYIVQHNLTATAVCGSIKY